VLNWKELFEKKDKPMFSLMLIKEFLEDIKKQKTRAILTTVAIAWGCLTMILLMAFGSGLSFRLREGLLNAADRIIMIGGGQTGKKFEGLPLGRSINLVEDDARILEESIPMVAAACPQQGKWVRLRNGDKSASTFMEGVYPTFEFLRRMYPAAGGRFLNEKDLAGKRRVVFLGSEVSKEVLGSESPIGKIITIDGVPFTVVGILPKKLQTAMNNGPDDRRAVIPFSTFMSIYGYRYIDRMLVKPVRSEESKQVVQEVRRVLGRKYKFDPTDENAVWAWDIVEMVKIQDRVFLGLNIFLAVIGTMTLVIAGVGVANIMYVVVKERTREIGIKRACGAKRKHIIFQIVFEALLMSLVGGLAGLGVSTAIVKAVWMIPVEQGAMQFLGRPLLSTSIVLTAVIVLGLTGLLAGLFPARKAANIDPIEALRYE
jgi:putative ABC transport system permease protein